MGTHGNMPDRKKKKPSVSAGLEYFFGSCWNLNWWRRRELNPRPQALHSQPYMLSLII
jgi:hypothetical protein